MSTSSRAPGDEPLDHLVAAHPKIFRERQPEIWSDLPAGWYGIADELCSAIEAELGDKADQFSIRQIKEKFGELRVYCHINSSMDDRQAALRALIDAATSRSTATCQKCGRPGLNSSIGGWWATRCPEHTPVK